MRQISKDWLSTLKILFSLSDLKILVSTFLFPLFFLMIYNFAEYRYNIDEEYFYMYIITCISWIIFWFSFYQAIIISRKLLTIKLKIKKKQFIKKCLQVIVWYFIGLTIILFPFLLEIGLVFRISLLNMIFILYGIMVTSTFFAIISSLIAINFSKNIVQEWIFLIISLVVITIISGFSAFYIFSDTGYFFKLFFWSPFVTYALQIATYSYYVIDYSFEITYLIYTIVNIVLLNLLALRLWFVLSKA